MRRFGPVLFAVLSVAACGDDPAASAPACGVVEASDAVGTSQASKYIGRTFAELEAEADRLDLVVRVLGEDGSCTGDRIDDYRDDRVNVYLQGDRVTAARVF